MAYPIRGSWLLVAASILSSLAFAGCLGRDDLDIDLINGTAHQVAGSIEIRLNDTLVAKIDFSLAPHQGVQRVYSGHMEERSGELNLTASIPGAESEWCSLPAWSAGGPNLIRFEWTDAQAFCTAGFAD